MSTKNTNISRVIIELPKAQHRKLKSFAALHGKSMREVILQALEASDIYLDKKPTAKKTLKLTEKLQKPKIKFKALKIDTKGFKFNRENIYDE